MLLPLRLQTDDALFVVVDEKRLTYFGPLCTVWIEKNFFSPCWRAFRSGLSGLLCSHGWISGTQG